MKRDLRITCSMLVIMLCAFFNAEGVARAQVSEQYVISARAGGVNLVSGNVSVIRGGSGQQQALTTGQNLESGDAVRTGAGGRVEVLLSPGAYLRAAENSEFELTDAALDTLRVKLISGSAVVEAAGADGARLFLEVATPQAQVTIDRKGIYRFNVPSGGVTEILVRKGEARVGGDRSAAVKVKDGKKATMARGGEVAVAKFDKKDQDAFDSWSGQRAEQLASASRKLSSDRLASSYASNQNNSLWGRGGSRSLGGLWVYDPFFGYQTFSPFYHGWSSPYGHSYWSGFGFPTHRHSLFGGRYIGRTTSIFIGISPHRHRTHRHRRH